MGSSRSYCEMDTSLCLSLAFVLGFGVLSVQTQFYSGQKPIPEEQLYSDFDKTDPCTVSNVRTETQSRTCLRTSEQYSDYVCRYNTITRRRCYCCGMIFAYIEHGEICTKFCLKTSERSPRFGQPKLINLPFNFGSLPRKIRLENGTEIPVTAEVLGEDYD